ncbi:MAG: cysteine synthase A [Muribaculaceae bacterium]|nr:cysteine synthase A [Muribaculaceae bacterium]
MKRVYSSLTELIGNTPLLELSILKKELGLKADILAKLEYFNPGGSVKDRVALSMIEDAERRGVLKPGGYIIEPTSGNTGIGLAWVASIKGYHLILTMPETMSIERQKLLSALGATIVLTPGDDGMAGAIIRAEQLQKEIEGAIILQQFANKANPTAHYTTTAEELWRDTNGTLDIFVACVGTGGTLSGTSRKLKELSPHITTIAVEPSASPVLSGGKAGKHAIQGIGAGFIPENYDSSVVDEILTVSDDEAISTARLLARYEGVLVGVSSGAATSAAIRLAQKECNVGKTIVVVLPDTGERYLSTGLFN